MKTNKANTVVEAVEKLEENVEVAIKETPKAAETIEATEKTEGYSDKDIKVWKAEHKKIYRTYVNNDEYVWRKLKRTEYTQLMSNKAEDGREQLKLYERQEAIATMVVLYPTNIAELIEENCGLATTISDEVVSKSGFDFGGTEEL
jgi:hypothetical protein